MRLEIVLTLAYTVLGYRSYDGSGNNQDGITGSAMTPLGRIDFPAAFADGFADLAGADRPSVTQISNILLDSTISPPSNRLNLSSFVVAWAQFVQHDLFYLKQSTLQNETLSVPLADCFNSTPACKGQKVNIVVSCVCVFVIMVVHLVHHKNRCNFCKRWL